ncbi:PREDICTED: gastric triacylglycerol lipase-like isoform X2 [Nicrophorus vespilloides]|uniref:Gastric triacylglycerol lipase-like isoform X2 n=1 Tax=Nicrophorus vespilloides TaxID=110193 RepID=A0ABM1M4D3_NICVS|nr:PREDICTED: gastric triacylglycerol lipase-like isoform X2 [Nicrophorus vespilloides]
MEQELPLRSSNFSDDYFTVITEDGYVLGLYRLVMNTSDSAKAGVLLMHGATVSGSIWVDRPKERCLAFRLCDRNFDVWIANFRGTIYSNKHIHFAGNSSEYWNYSFHEIGIYDIPAILETIYERNGGKKVFLIGISMGGTAATIYASLKPKHCEKHVKAIISMSGSIFFTGITSIYKHISPHVYDLYKFGESIGFRNFAPSIITRFTLLRDFLTNFPPARILMQVFLFSTFGYDSTGIHEGFYPSILGHVPAGISLKTILHYAQLVTKEDKFDFFDNGPSENLKIYGVRDTPAYPLENINTFFYILAGGNDTLVTPKGCRKFYDLLAEDKRKMDIIEGYNHIHWLYGEDLDKGFIPTIDFMENNLNL